MVVAQGLIHTVDCLFCALAPIGQAKILARVAMKVVFLPKVRVHVLIRIVKVFALKGSRLPKAVSGHGKIDVEDQQQQSDAKA